jgi:type IV pilus assembly protein PilA
MNNSKGFTLIELLMVIAIIGILTGIAIPIFAPYKERALDGDTKSHLHNIYLACKAYWVDNGSAKECNDTIASSTGYGYIKDPKVFIKASGDEFDFGAKAHHLDSLNSYKIDEKGKIKKDGNKGKKK